MPANPTSVGLSLPLTPGPIPTSLGVAEIFAVAGVVMARLNDGTTIALNSGGLAFPILAPLGAAAAPSYSFAAAPLDGMFSFGPGLALSSPAFVALIAGASNLSVTAIGEVNINGTPGAAGQVPISAGAGAPAAWSALPASAIIVSDEGAPIAGNPFTTLDFVGAGITATNLGGGVAAVTVPAPSIVVRDEGVPIVGNPFTTLDFVGAGVTAADLGGGVASITVPVPVATITVQDEGAPIAGNPFTTLNFTGAGVTATNLGGGVAGVAVPAIPGAAVFTFGAENISSSADTRVMPPGYTDGLLNTNTPKGFRSPRAGTLRNLTARHNTAVGNGASVVYTVRINGVATLLSVTLATAAIGSTINSVNTVAVAAGDLVELIKVTAAAIGSGALDVICAAEFF